MFFIIKVKFPTTEDLMRLSIFLTNNFRIISLWWVSITYIYIYIYDQMRIRNYLGIPVYTITPTISSRCKIKKLNRPFENSCQEIFNGLSTIEIYWVVQKLQNDEDYQIWNYWFFRWQGLQAIWSRLIEQCAKKRYFFLDDKLVRALVRQSYEAYRYSSSITSSTTNCCFQAASTLLLTAPPGGP